MTSDCLTAESLLFIYLMCTAQTHEDKHTVHTLTKQLHNKTLTDKDINVKKRKVKNTHNTDFSKW